MQMEQFCVGFFKDTYFMQATQGSTCPMLFKNRFFIGPSLVPLPNWTVHDKGL
jgi:hypothetical protein